MPGIQAEIYVGTSNLNPSMTGHILGNVIFVPKIIDLNVLGKRHFVTNIQNGYKLGKPNMIELGSYLRNTK